MIASWSREISLAYLSIATCRSCFNQGTDAKSLACAHSLTAANWRTSWYPMSRPSANAEMFVGTRAVTSPSVRGRPESVVPSASFDISVRALPICEANAIAAIFGSIEDKDWASPAIWSSWPKSPAPICDAIASAMAREAFSATGLQIFFQAGSVWSTHSTLVQASRVTPLTAKLVTGSSHRSATASACRTVCACAAERRGSPDWKTCWRNISSTMRQFTGSEEAFMRKRI